MEGFVGGARFGGDDAARPAAFVGAGVFCTLFAAL